MIELGVAIVVAFAIAVLEVLFAFVLLTSDAHAPTPADANGS